MTARKYVQVHWVALQEASPELREPNSFIIDNKTHSRGRLNLLSWTVNNLALAPEGGIISVSQGCLLHNCPGKDNLKQKL